MRMEESQLTDFILSRCDHACRTFGSECRIVSRYGRDCLERMTLVRSSNVKISESPQANDFSTAQLEGEVMRNRRDRIARRATARVAVVVRVVERVGRQTDKSARAKERLND